MEVIIKPTHACNCNCVYCSAANYDDHVAVMPLETVEHVLTVFRGYLEADPRHVVRFIWHGGEPLVCGAPFYTAVAEMQERIFKGLGHRLRNMFQSNLTLLTEELLPPLTRLLKGDPVGTSFDYLPGVRGLRDKRPLAEPWLAAVRRLRAAEVPVGVVYVVHSGALEHAAQLYYFFKNVDPAISVRFNPLYAEGRANESDAKRLHITAEEYGQFLVDLLDVWKQDNMSTSVMPLAEWKRAWLGDANALCCDSRSTCHISHLGINPDGSVYGCGRASDNGEFVLGNILQDDLGALLNHPLRVRLGDRAARLREGECSTCSYWELCHGGCPMISSLYYDDVMRKTYFCASRKRLFAAYEQLFGPPRLHAAKNGRAQGVPVP